MKGRRPKLLGLTFRTWGGARKGAGRKPAGAKAGVPHAARPKLNAAHPVHVTLRVRPDVPSLRAQRCVASIRRAFAAANGRLGFRVVHYSIQSNHLHLVAEAPNARALSRALQGLTIRVARGLNRNLVRSGRVFADRYHARALKTPREVRNALRYVLLNWSRHSGRAARSGDPCSSAALFNGWRRPVPVVSAPHDLEKAAVASARTWLLRGGWRRAGPIDPQDVPS